MTREEAIDRIEDHMQVHKIGQYPHIKLKVALDMAIEALRVQREPNPPLTLEELREMDGEPVWLHTFSAVQKKTNIAQWAIVESVSNANAVFVRAGCNSRLIEWFCNYGTRWLAYRRKPEEV